MKNTLVNLALAAGLAWSNCRPLEDSTLTVAILPFKDRIGLPEAILQGMPDMIATDLVSHSKVKVVERSQVTNAMEAQKLEGQNLSTTERASMAKWLGAKSFILGSLTPMGNQIRLDLRLVNVQSGELMCAASATKDRGEMDLLLNSALQNLGLRSENEKINTFYATLPTKLSKLQISFKITNSFFNERAVPVQKIQVYMDGNLLGESKLLNQIDEEILLFQQNIPTGKHILELKMGEVNKFGKWNRELVDQPPLFHVVAQEKSGVEISCTEVVSDSKISYKCTNSADF